MFAVSFIHANKKWKFAFIVVVS